MMAIASSCVSLGCLSALFSNRKAMSRVSSGIFFQALARKGDEEMRQSHQSHVVVPTGPRARLVMSHSQVTLSLLEKFFEAPTTSCYHCYRLHLLLVRMIHQVVFEIVRVLSKT